MKKFATIRMICDQQILIYEEVIEKFIIKCIFYVEGICAMTQLIYDDQTTMENAFDEFEQGKHDEVLVAAINEFVHELEIEKGYKGDKA